MEIFFLMTTAKIFDPSVQRWTALSYWYVVYVANSHLVNDCDDHLVSGTKKNSQKNGLLEGKTKAYICQICKKSI